MTDDRPPLISMRTAKLPQQPLQLLYYMGASVILLWYLAVNIQTSSTLPASKEEQSESANSTLGFEKIFYISLPHRSDRQDAMTLIAAASGLSLTLQHGVNGSFIHEKARPEGSKHLRPEQLGCWRAHANVWRRIISENIETALILEDDVDWDINIRDVFAEFSRHMNLQKVFQRLLPRTTPETAPYGSGWDILYVGSSTNIPNLNDLPPHYLYHDPHVPDYYQLARSYRREIEVWGINATEQTQMRLVAPSWYPVGALGYAITKRAARILLYHLGGYRGLGLPVDLVMISLIQKGIVESYTVIPPLITPFRVGGAKDSDIDEKRYTERRGDLPPGSENLKSSVRSALADLIRR